MLLVCEVASLPALGAARLRAFDTAIDGARLIETDRADTDGDGVSDRIERMVGSDPDDPASMAASVLVSEFMARNRSTLFDEDGDSADWIELVNATGAGVDLGGFHLTDDPRDLAKWTLPEGTTLAPNQFLIVFASGKDRARLDRELHTDFVLDAKGSYLALVAPDGAAILQQFAPKYPAQKPDVSFDFSRHYRTEPTPGEADLGPAVKGFVADTRFSIDRGFYGKPISVDITTDTPGATIVYTTDSTTPSLRNGARVAGSAARVSIRGTTVLRAAAYAHGLAPTNVDTHTYLFTRDIVVQSDDPDDYEYPNWNNHYRRRTADYGMDREQVVGALHSRAQVEASLRSLPTLAIATDAAQLFSRRIGVYANSRVPRLERVVSLELFGFDHGRHVQIDGGLRIAGMASRGELRHKHNLRIAFRRRYGDGALEFPLFPDAKVAKFGSLQLRGGNSDAWIFPRPEVRKRATYLRDQWHRDAHIAMGRRSQAQRYAHLYINGLYWGVYHVFERIEDDYMERHFGGDRDDWDVRDHAGSFDGNDDAWNAAFAIANRPAGLADPKSFAALQEYIDLDELIDYVLLHFYSNSDDWDGNNVRAGRNRVTPDTFRFFAWDQERTMLNTISSPDVGGAIAIDRDTHSALVDDEGEPLPDGPTHLHQRLRANPEYRLRFADRVQKHCFHGGTLTPTAASALWDARAAQVRPAMIAESARWGDLHGDLNTPEDWEARVEFEKANWFAVRTPILVRHLRDRGLYPKTPAPEFTLDGMPRHGGPAARGAILGINAPVGEIYYTLDGRDPRAVGGDIRGERFVAAINLGRPAWLKARAHANGEWSALAEARFTFADTNAGEDADPGIDAGSAPGATGRVR